VLDVVEDEQHILDREKARHRLLAGLARHSNDRQRLDDRRRDILRPAYGRQRDEPGTVGEVRLGRATRLNRQARLADPARARERKQPNGRDTDAVCDRANIVRAADGPVRRRRQATVGAARPNP
jgi:hypothetical protein